MYEALLRQNSEKRHGLEPVTQDFIDEMATNNIQCNNSDMAYSSKHETTLFEILARDILL